MNSANKLHRPSNKQLRRVLVSARSIIKNREEKFVCLALGTAASRDPSRAAASFYLHAYIRKQLKGNTFLEGWQANHGTYQGFAGDRRQNRIDWINWMIDSLDGVN